MTSVVVLTAGVVCQKMPITSLLDLKLTKLCLPSRFVDSPKGVKCWTSRRVWCLTKPFLISMVFIVKYGNQLLYFEGCLLNRRYCKRPASVVFHVRVCFLIEFAPHLFLSARLMNTNLIPFFSSPDVNFYVIFRYLCALCSAGCRLFFGPVMCTLDASWI